VVNLGPAPDDTAFQRQAEARRPEERRETDQGDRHEKKRKERPKRPSGENPLAELDRMVGMSAVKEQLQKLDAWAWRQSKLRESGVDSELPSLHMSFAGNPGTGKTTVARIIGKLLHSYGLIDRPDVHEKGRADLVARFVGQTADQTKKVIEEAVGGVLFIDEAYALSEAAQASPQDFGPEALAVLVSEMENRRDELCVIVAGYPAEMERFLDVNPGLASRISRRIVFPDYTNDELCQVFTSMVEARQLTCDAQVLPLLRTYAARAQATLPPRRWGNARSIRNMLEAGIENQAVRLRATRAQASRDELLRLTIADFAFLRDRNITIV
jgi:stage V sporulation protein K